MSSSGPRTMTSRAGTGRCRPTTPRASRRTIRTCGRRRACPASGSPTQVEERSAVDFSPEERQPIFEAAWAKGGFYMGLETFSDLPGQQGQQRHGLRVHPRQDPRDGQGPGRRGAAGAEGPSVLHQAAAAGERLLRELQPGQRDPAGRAVRADRGDHAARRADRRARVRGRRDRLRHRLRRDDRHPVRHGHHRPGRTEAAGQVGGRTAHLPRPHHLGVPEPVRHHRAAEPVRAVQHAGRDRAERGVDRRPHPVHARA